MIKAFNMPLIYSWNFPSSISPSMLRNNLLCIIGQVNAIQAS